MPLGQARVRGPAPMRRRHDNSKLDEPHHGADVREFRKARIDKSVWSKRSLLMRSARSGARVTTDPAGKAALMVSG